MKKIIKYSYPCLKTTVEIFSHSDYVSPSPTLNLNYDSGLELKRSSHVTE